MDAPRKGAEEGVVVVVAAAEEAYQGPGPGCPLWGLGCMRAVVCSLLGLAVRCGAAVLARGDAE